MANVVGDELLGKIARQQHDWFRRIREGSLDPEKVLLVHGLMQDFADGKIPQLPGVIRGTHEIKAIDNVIDLAIPGKPALAGSKLRIHYAVDSGENVVKVEKGEDGVFVDGNKLHLFYSELSREDATGHDLQKEVEARGNTVSSNLLDYFESNPSMWPEEWKKNDNKGDPLCVCFWGDIFEDYNQFLYVRLGFWDRDQVFSGTICLDTPIRLMGFTPAVCIG
ncbi:MAG: hypothetical protein KBC48_02320 [Candidatus Pacebacteria bacterium]|nr:hypothetical protein [Candidatus Paceibacterota bacterium]